MRARRAEGKTLLSGWHFLFARQRSSDERSSLSARPVIYRAGTPTDGAPMTADQPNESSRTATSSRVLPAGTPAPDFTLPNGPDSAQRLSDLRGRPVILVFYPADWSPVCGDELALYNELLPEFRRHDAELVGISVDGVWCHRAYAEARHLEFPLLSDFEPKGAVSRAYGAYRARDGFSERALFVLDRDGVIRWSYLSPVNVNPGADGILAALEALPSATANIGATS
jgi:peroxiredoxin